MPDTWATSSSFSARESQAETSHSFKRHDNVLSDRRASGLTRGSRGARVRSVTRAPSTHSQGQNLTNAEVQKRRLTKEKQQLQDKKEEALGVVPKATTLGIETERGLRAGVQAESRDRAFVLTFRFRQKGREVLTGIGGQVARASSLVATPECGPLIKRCRMLNEASVASPLVTIGIQANEADILRDRSGLPVDCRDSFAGVHPEACCADVNTYHSSGSFAAIYSHTFTV